MIYAFSIFIFNLAVSMGFMVGDLSDQEDKKITVTTVLTYFFFWPFLLILKIGYWLGRL